MRRMHWSLYAWPGLGPAWLLGDWRGVVLAIAAAAWVNPLLLATFVWAEWWPSPLRLVAWWGSAGLWAGAAMVCRRWMASSAPRRPKPDGDPLAAAMTHYLKRNWFEAELALVGLLKADAGDVEARLMLASLLRRRERFGEAAAQLNALDRIEGAEFWLWERHRERQLLAQAQTDAAAQAEPEMPVGSSAIVNVKLPVVVSSLECGALPGTHQEALEGGTLPPAALSRRTDLQHAA